MEARKGNVLLTTLFAGMAGAGIALLVAPQSGRETRAKLRTKANDMKQKADQGVTVAKDALETGKQHAQQVGSTVREAAGRVHQEARTASKEVAHQVRESKQQTKSPTVQPFGEEV